MGIFQELNDHGITIIMVTHEVDIARYTRRNVIMRDGLVCNDRPVTDRLNAVQELERLSVETDEALQTEEVSR